MCGEHGIFYPGWGPFYRMDPDLGESYPHGEGAPIMVKTWWAEDDTFCFIERNNPLVHTVNFAKSKKVIP